MKYTILLLLISLRLSALDIYLNSAKQNNSPYAILHIVDNEPIECHTIPLSLNKKSYICKFNKIIKNRIGIKKLEFVDIDFLKKKKEFYIKVDPKFNSTLSSLNEELFRIKEVVEEKNSSKSKHWLILLFKKLPFGKKVKNNGINFPITYGKYMMPSIGPVDLNGVPIAYAKDKDINYYLNIQKEFAKGNYESVIQDANKLIKLYPNSIFTSDILLYKIKSIDIGLEKKISFISDKYENIDVIKESKQWIRRYASNENIPQMLLILVKNYIKTGSASDINYFLDILVTEHKNSSYTKRAILYYADFLYNNKKNKAIELYKNVLYSAKDLDIASDAAIRLANSKINSGNTKEAKQYLVKVLQANKKYLLKDRDATDKLAVKLSSNGLQKIAATINDLLLKNIGKNQRHTKELLLKRAGDWYLASNDTAKAYTRYMQYKKEYKNGTYIDEVDKAIDRLFFKVKEANETKLAQYYDVLISKYHNDIKDKAIIEKAKLFLKNKKYQKIIDMKKMLVSIDDRNSTIAKELIKKSAIMLINKSLNKEDCHKVVDLIEANSIDYNNITKSKKLFKCLLITARYKKASILAKRKISVKKLEEKFIWLENLAKVYVKMQKFNDVIALKNDIFLLSKMIKKQIDYPTYKALFNALYYNKKYDKSLEIIKEIDIHWLNKLENIEMYYKIINYGDGIKNDFLLSKYANKILHVEKKYKIYTYSPMVDFIYINALKRLYKNKKAKEIAKNLIKLKLNQKDKSRVFFELGELSYKLKERKKAKEYFIKCSKIKNSNSWKKLCEDSMKLFE